MAGAAVPPRRLAMPSAPGVAPAGPTPTQGFRPPWWCRNPHVQTLWGPFTRRRTIPLRRERVITPDGDFVDLDWLPDPAPPGAPLLLLLHGLEGNARSHYIVGLLRLARREGWRAAVLSFRSCSGEMNRLPRFYHSGDTADLDHVLRLLLAREPAVRVVAAGVSLGGNVLLKWLGEQAGATPAQIVGAVGISVPFDLEACARRMDRGVQKALYTASFMRSFRRKVRAKAQDFPAGVDVAAAIRARTFAEYDRAVTAPLHGFADETDYWRRASSGPYLARVRAPTLLISSRDDPFIPAASLPDPTTLPPPVRTRFVDHGGHVGFLDGTPWRPRSWAERRAVEFLREVLDGRALC